MARGAHSSHTGTNKRAKLEVNLKRTDEARRALIHEVGNARRADVYRTDVEFAGRDVTRRKLPPLPQGEELDVLVAKIVRMREARYTYAMIAAEVGFSETRVRTLYVKSLKEEK